MLEGVIAWGEGLVKDRHHPRAGGAVRTTEEPPRFARPAGTPTTPCPSLASPSTRRPSSLSLLTRSGHGSVMAHVPGRNSPARIQRLLCESQHGIEVVDRGHPPWTSDSYQARTYALRKCRHHLNALGLLRVYGDVSREGRSKHIPPSYLIASEEQRRALLAGLLDTDGTVSRTGAGCRGRRVAGGGAAPDNRAGSGLLPGGEVVARRHRTGVEGSAPGGHDVDVGRVELLACRWPRRTTAVTVADRWARVGGVLAPRVLRVAVLCAGSVPGWF